MIALLREVWAIVVALWNTGNRLIRIALAAIILWPVAIIGAGLTGLDAVLWIVLALMPVAIFIGALGFRDPMVVAVLTQIDATRHIMGEIVLKLLIIFGLELAFGIMLFWLRPAEHPQLFLILILIILAIVALVLGAEWWTGKTVAKTAVIVLTLLGLLLVGAMYFGFDSGLGSSSIRSTRPPPAARKTEASLAPFTVSIPLIGEGKESHQYFDTGEHLFALGLRGWRCAFSGPPTAMAHLDGVKESAPITKWLGYRIARVRFSGPAGEVVTTYCVPPR